jgi:hypothetical protein
MRRCVDDLVLLLVIVIEVWLQLANDEFRMSNDEGLRMICCFFGRGRHSCAPFLGVQRTARPTFSRT